MEVLKAGFQNREGWTKNDERGAELSDVLSEHRSSRFSFKIRRRIIILYGIVIKVGFLNFITRGVGL
jgi:hypothetical protein